jgi:polar amino acid transport system substrate-binding protein/glutamate/aspartate transport system substrate-binding protein
MSGKRWAGAVSVAVLLLGVALPALADTIDKIKADQTIRIAYREDAAPFSYKDANAAGPAGYIVELCRAVAAKLKDDLGVPALKVAYVSVTAANRFDAIAKGDADLLCEATTETLSRREKVDFSIPTFVDGAGLLSRDSKLGKLSGLTGRKIGVLAGTTTEDELRQQLQKAGIPADVIPAKSHAEGLAMIDSGKISAYFADRSILMFMIKDAKDPSKLFIADNYLSVEPYALALARGDDKFRLAVDTALSHIYRGGDIPAIFDKAFAGKAKLAGMAQMLYFTAGLPD